MIQTRIANEKYLRTHKEVSLLISGFFREMFLKRPDNILEFAALYRVPTENVLRFTPRKSVYNGFNAGGSQDGDSASHRCYLIIHVCDANLCVPVMAALRRLLSPPRPASQQCRTHLTDGRLGYRVHLSLHSGANTDEFQD
ncbi:hypothetical protein ACRRTK_023073 [Alexandromys fortis]